MDVERIHLETSMADLIVAYLTPAELNRLRYDASIATTERPGRYDALTDFLEATDDV